MARTLCLRQAIQLATLAAATATENALIGRLLPAFNDLLGPVSITWVAGTLHGRTMGTRSGEGDGARSDSVVLADLRSPSRVEFARSGADFDQDEFDFLQLLRPHLLAAMARVERRIANPSYATAPQRR
ncbi:MAG: hypothetical protein ACRDSE_08275 [Pseudonocardiaceae bacterium]